MMNTDTYMVMRGSKVLGYVEAYSTYHALIMAEKLYGKNLIIERISQVCQAQIKQADSGRWQNDIKVATVKWLSSMAQPYLFYNTIRVGPCLGLGQVTHYDKPRMSRQRWG